MKIATTAKEWINVQALGTWLEDRGNGEIWEYNGCEWYLSHLELLPGELRELMDALSVEVL